MTDQHQPLLAPGLVDRVVGLLKRPDLEWPIIAAEETSVKRLFKTYALPLAIIGPLASLINAVGFNGENVIEEFLVFVVGFGLNLLAAYILGIVIDGLAHNFASPKASLPSMKLGVYAMTPFWLLGTFNLISGTLAGALTLIFGLYGAYLLYRGLEPLKQTPQDKRLGYTIAATVVWVLLTLVVFGLIFAVLSAFAIIGEGSSALLNL